MASKEGASTLTHAECNIKKGELSYVKVDNQDDLPDVPKKTWRKSWITMMEKDLSFLYEEHDEEKEAFMRLKPRVISRIVEPGKKFLCLEYGPKKKPMFILLDFTNEPSGCLEDWEDALRRMMGLASPHRRRRTETSQTMRRPNQSNRYPRTQSAFQPPTLMIPEISIQAPDVFEPLPGTESGGKSPGGASTGSDTGSDLSPFSSLKSTCSCYPLPEELNCNKERLSQHEFKDHKSEIIVTKTLPGSGLHVGDVISIKSADEPNALMDTARLREYIRETQEQEITLVVTRGVEITVKEEERELIITIKGPKAKRPDKVDVVMKACDTNDESGLAIAEINDEPVAVGTQTEEVTQRLRAALQQSHESHLHLIPQSLMRADKGEVQDDARPIDVGDISHEETEC